MELELTLNVLYHISCVGLIYMVCMAYSALYDRLQKNSEFAFHHTLSTIINTLNS